MIGWFSVGFYFIDLVVDKIIVVFKHNDNGQYILESSAGNSFTVRAGNDPELQRGTKIILLTKEDQAEFIQEKIKEIVKKLSKFTGYPIKLLVQKDKEKMISDNETDAEPKVLGRPLC